MANDSEPHHQDSDSLSGDISARVEPQVRAERSNPHYDDEGGSKFVPFVIAVSILFAVAVGAITYIIQYPVPGFLAPVKVALTPTPPASPYKEVYERFGITPFPIEFERKYSSILRPLDQFRREPCDSSAIIPLMDVLMDAGYRRESAKVGQSFSKRCRPYDDVIEKTFALFGQLNDHQSALAVADDAVRSDQASGRYRFFRGTAYEGLKNYKAALADYTSSLQLFTDLSNVALSEFYRISRMYVAIGRPCDAITPLEMYLSYNVEKRQTAQISRLIKEYADQGRCRATYASGETKVFVTTSNVVDVIINGAKGRMIVDTGASMVSMTPSFAARARILPDEENMMTVYVVGGTAKSAPGYAQTIEVGSSRAANVPVGISVGKDSAYGPEIDGLLGMTFLARFNVTLGNGVLELKSRALD